MVLPWDYQEFLSCGSKVHGITGSSCSFGSEIQEIKNSAGLAHEIARSSCSFGSEIHITRNSSNPSIPDSGNDGVLTAKAALPALLKLSRENWQKAGLDLTVSNYESEATTKLIEIGVAETAVPSGN